MQISARDFVFCFFSMCCIHEGTNVCQFSAACGGAASFMTDVCTRRGYSALTNFQMSFLKPLVPAWLHAGWSRITREPAMVLRGWDSCAPAACLMSAAQRWCVMQSAQCMTPPTLYIPSFPRVTSVCYQRGTMTPS